jgi:hypothetical protein
MVEGNHPFQIAWLDEEKRESMIHEMTQRPDYADKAPGRMIVFEGNVAPTIEECEPLNAWIANRSVSNRLNADGVPAWIGDPVAISEPMCIRFQRSGGQNILIVGQEGDLADSILASTILSICSGPAGRGASEASRLVLLHDGQDQTSQLKFASSFTKGIAPRFSLRKAAEADATVAELSAELATREAAGDGSNSPTIILAIRNIGQFRSLRRDEDDFGMSGFGATKSATPASQLGDLIRKGPLVGIHVIVWSDTFSNAMRWLSNSLLREFDSRIAFRLNQTDSSSLIDTPAAASLSPGRAILYRDQTGAADRFRPFSWPSQQWLSNVPTSPEEEIIPPSQVIEQTPTAATPALEPEVAEAVAEAMPAGDTIETTIQEPAAGEPVISQPAATEVLPTVAAEVTTAPAELLVSKVQTPEADASQIAAAVSETPAAVEAISEVVAEATSAPSANDVVAPAESVVTASEVRTADASVPVVKVDASEPTKSEVKVIPVTESVANTVAPAAQPPAAPAAEKAQPSAKPLASEPEAPKHAAPKEPVVAEKPVIAEKPPAPPAKTPAKQKQSGKSPVKPVAETPKSVPQKPAQVPAQSPKPQTPAAVTPVSKPPVTPSAPASTSADDDMDFVLDDSVFAKAVPPVAPTPPPAASKPKGSVPPTPAAVAPATPEAAPKKVGKPTAMAVRLSSRRTDHNRLLDAPPEPKVPTEPRLSPDQEAPSSDFDEMDFNSLMIE